MTSPVLIKSPYKLGCSLTDSRDPSYFLVLVSSYNCKAHCHLLESGRNTCSGWYESMAGSRQAGKGDRSVTECQTKGINKKKTEPPIVVKFAVRLREPRSARPASSVTRHVREFFFFLSLPSDSSFEHMLGSTCIQQDEYLPPF